MINFKVFMSNKYDPDEAISLDRLRKVDSRTFIQLCEKAGYLSVAYDFYSRKPGDKDLEHAVEIAKRLSNLPRERKIDLVRRLRESYQRGRTEAIPSRGLGGDWADAYSQSSADARRSECQEKISMLNLVEQQLGLDISENK